MSAEQKDGEEINPDPEDEEAGAESVELDYLAGIDNREPAVHGKDGAWAGPAIPEPPIPESPLHLCPNCNYNLTGLTCHRCPECGQHFTLAEARLHAYKTTPDGPQEGWVSDLKHLGGCLWPLLLISLLLAWVAFRIIAKL